MNLFNNSVPDLEETAGEVVVDKEPVEETEELDLDATNESDVEVEEAREVDDTDTEDESNDSDGVYLINGEEYTENDLKHAKDYKHLEANYTKKTMALSEQRKNLESKMDSLDKLTQELQVLVSEESEINWQELKEDDPDEYIKQKEKFDRRKDALKNAKSNLGPSELSQEQLAVEFNTLVYAHPEWVKRDDKGNVIEVTQQYKDDIKAISSHAQELGFTNEEIASFQRAPAIQVLIDSMRVKELEQKLKEKENKIEVVKKSVAPKAIKPSSVKPQQQPTSLFNKSIGS